jgi:hypothetical protein
MFRFLCSSIHLANKLREIQFEDGESVLFVSKKISEDVLLIETDCRDINVFVSFSPFVESGIKINQTDRRWDWVKDLLCKVDDQPILIEINEQIVNVIFQY